MSDLVLGIDGGGTKTVLALADRAGHVVWQKRAPGIGPHENPAWLPTLQALMATASAYGDRVAYGAFAMPSFGEIDRVSAEQAAAAQQLGHFPHCVLNDVHAAFEGAFVGQPGVLLLAGTGSMLWAEDGAGAQIRVGGWGQGFGDEGSAFWIGRAAIAGLSQCLDGRAADPDFAAAMSRLLALPAEGQAEALLDWYCEVPDPRVKVASLAREIDRMAETGNATATTILTEAAAHLALHVRAAWQRLPTLPEGVWSAVGSIMNSRVVARHLVTLLDTPRVPAALPPVGGALWRAATNAGWAASPAWIDRLRTELSLQS
ncbi:MAG TPA: BadF/BadG/BcrA/BcrD ATPase family protein [Acidisoma sp.]|nr:BadF/BadG/BcrA/BcrD ATPase family protein [Acidisoma sp.]